MKAFGHQELQQTFTTGFLLEWNAWLPNEATEAKRLLHYYPDACYMWIDAQFRDRPPSGPEAVQLILVNGIGCPVFFKMITNRDSEMVDLTAGDWPERLDRAKGIWCRFNVHLLGDG